jgi:hypothetical protein
MALAARYQINFVIWTPARGSDFTTSCYYRASHKALIILRNHEGQSHYEPVTLLPNSDSETASLPVIIGADDDTAPTSPVASNLNHDFSTPCQLPNVPLAGNSEGSCAPLTEPRSQNNIGYWILLKAHNLRLKYFTTSESIMERILSTIDASDNLYVIDKLFSNTARARVLQFMKGSTTASRNLIYDFYNYLTPNSNKYTDEWDVFSRFCLYINNNTNKLYIPFIMDGRINKIVEYNYLNNTYHIIDTNVVLRPYDSFIYVGYDDILLPSTPYIIYSTNNTIRYDDNNIYI